MNKGIPARWPRLLTEASAAEYFSISVNSLRRLRLQTIRIAHRPLYDRHALDAWVGHQMATASADGVDLTDDVPFEIVQRSEEDAHDWRADQPGLRGAQVIDNTLPVTPIATEREVLSVGQVAARWGTGTDAVYALVRSGDLMHFKLGTKLIRIKREWVEKYELDHPALTEDQ